MNCDDGVPRFSLLGQLSYLANNKYLHSYINAKSYFFFYFSDQSLDMDLYGGNRLPPPIPRSSQHELKRPDSVITTSSIVSSDTASQAGDSSTEASGEPFQKHTFTSNE